jgi:hypothetical protein
MGVLHAASRPSIRYEQDLANKTIIELVPVTPRWVSPWDVEPRADSYGVAFVCHHIGLRYLLSGVEARAAVSGPDSCCVVASTRCDMWCCQSHFANHHRVLDE